MSTQHATFRRTGQMQTLIPASPSFHRFSPQVEIMMCRLAVRYYYERSLTLEKAHDLLRNEVCLWNAAKAPGQALLRIPSRETLRRRVLALYNSQRVSQNGSARVWASHFARRRGA